MQRLLFIFISCFLLAGCVIHTDISHEFEHYGTDALRTDAEFFYIKQTATGSSRIAYKFNKHGQYTGGGTVKRGAIADAKSALAQNFPLKANQTYTNMSIDLTKAIRSKHTKGFFGSVSPIGKIQAITYNTVVSADIIEYGEPPISKDFSNSNNSSESMDNLTVKKLGKRQLYEGQEIIFKDFDGENYPGIIVGYDPLNKTYKVKYTKLEVEGPIVIDLSEGSRRMII